MVGHLEYVALKLIAVLPDKILQIFGIGIARNQTSFLLALYGQEFSFEGVKKYHLESKDILETITAPPMAEEIFYKNGKIFMMNESAGNKYIFGKFTTGLYTYSYAYRAA